MWPFTEPKCRTCARLLAACICHSTRAADQRRALNQQLPRPVRRKTTRRRRPARGER